VAWKRNYVHCFDKLKENAANPRKDWTWMELKQAARLLSRMKLIKDPPKLATNALFAYRIFKGRWTVLR
jgi:hypothetical protein